MVQTESDDCSLSFCLSIPALDAKNLTYYLQKSKFPASKWRHLAVSLKHAEHIPITEANNEGNVFLQLIDITQHWLDNDPRKSWNKLVAAVALSQENVVAEKLAKQVGVQYSSKLSNGCMYSEPYSI